MDKLQGHWGFHCGDCQRENMLEEIRRNKIRKSVSCFGLRACLQAILAVLKNNHFLNEHLVIKLPRKKKLFIFPLSSESNPAHVLIEPLKVTPLSSVCEH